MEWAPSPCGLKGKKEAGILANEGITDGNEMKVEIYYWEILPEVKIFGMKFGKGIQYKP